MFPDPFFWQLVSDSEKASLQIALEWKGKPTSGWGFSWPQSSGREVCHMEASGFDSLEWNWSVWRAQSQNRVLRPFLYYHLNKFLPLTRSKNTQADTAAFCFFNIDSTGVSWPHWRMNTQFLHIVRESKRSKASASKGAFRECLSHQPNT